MNTDLIENWPALFIADVDRDAALDAAPPSNLRQRLESALRDARSAYGDDIPFSLRCSLFRAARILADASPYAGESAEWRDREARASIARVEQRLDAPHRRSS